MKKVVVGHDAVISGHGWFLDRIIVRVNVPQCSKRYVFPCSRFVTAAAVSLLIAIIQYDKTNFYSAAA